MKPFEKQVNVREYYHHIRNTEGEAAASRMWSNLLKWTDGGEPGLWESFYSKSLLDSFTLK